MKSGKWRAADKDTAKIMLALAGRTRHGYLDNHDINNFPSEDLRIIDHLWVKYSNGRFGFSVQKQIYLNCGGKPDGKYPGDTIGYVTVWDKFGDQVGWRVNGKWLGSCWDSRVSLFNFDTLAPCGHLPFWVGFPGTYLGYGIELADWRWGGGLVSLLSRQDLLASTIP
nr:GUN4 domain-containing protein [Nodularia spumigena]